MIFLLSHNNNRKRKDFFPEFVITSLKLVFLATSVWVDKHKQEQVQLCKLEEDSDTNIFSFKTIFLAILQNECGKLK